MKRLRGVLFRLHWLLGLAAGLVLTVAGVTGALLSYEDAIGEIVDADLIHVAARSEAPLGPDALLARVRAQRPEGIASLTLSGEPGIAAMVRPARDPATVRRPPSLYLDPHDGTVRGAARTEDAFTFIRRLHRWLLLPGDGKGWGRTLTGLSVISLLVLMGTGLYLRWPKVMSWRIWLKLNLRQWGRPTYWSLHAVAGTWVLPVYLVIALTGLWWSYDGYREVATALLTRGETIARMADGKPPAGMDKPPAAKERPARSEVSLGAPGAPSLDVAWAAFRAVDGGRFLRATLLLPGGATDPVRIRSENRNGWRDDTRIEAATGRILVHEVGGERPLGVRMAANMVDLHSGRFFGVFGPPLFLAAALLMPLFLVTGLLLYVGRRAAAARRRGVSAAMPAVTSARLTP